MQIRLTEKQKEYIRESNHRWNIKHGATRSGKTFLDVYLIPMRIRDRAHEEGINLLLGNTKGTLQRNVIEPMQKLWGIRNISDIKADNTCRIFGEKCYCLGAEKINNVDRIRGASVKYCYGDEVATWEEDVFTMLKTRLDRKCSMFEGTTNPRNPDHWLKQFIDSGSDVYSQHYCIDDNTYLDPVVKAEMKKELSGVFYERYILGNWVLAEGLIYPMCDKALEKVSGQIRDCCMSIDYGTLNAFAALLWVRIGDVWYAERGYYYSGRESGMTKTDEEYGEELDRFFQNAVQELHLQPFLQGGRKMRTIIDPSAASFITLMQKKHWCKVMKADNDVLNGIRETATALDLGIIKLSPEIGELVQEIKGYSWDDSEDDKPIKTNDHYMDSMRYFVKTMHVLRMRNFRGLIT